METSNGVMTEDSRFQSAFDILGEDFIYPDEITRTLKLGYRDNQLNELKQLLPTDELLSKIQKLDCILLPEPPCSLTPYLISRLCEGHRWREGAILHNMEESRWLAIRKTRFPGDLTEEKPRKWSDQLALLSTVLGKELSGRVHVPRATQVMWALTVSFRLRGRGLFGARWVSTSSLASSQREEHSLHNVTWVSTGRLLSQKVPQLNATRVHVRIHPKQVMLETTEHPLEKIGESELALAVRL